MFTFTFNFRATPSVSQPKSPPEDDYLFVKQPSDDFFCPVTFDLLFQPHLTSCCGKHLSQEAAARIHKDRTACPLCNEQGWSTVLDKHFQRQVNSLRVFCRHEDRGCGWQGELAAFHTHIQSCLMSDAPLMTELVKQPLWVIVCVAVVLYPFCDHPLNTTSIHAW